MTEARGATRVLVMAERKGAKLKEPLKPEHEETLKLRLAGLTPEEIAKSMGVHLATVYTRLARPDVKAAHAAFQEARIQAVTDVLSGAAQMAAERLITIARDSVQEDQARLAAVAILDRSGHGPTSRTEVTGADGATLGIVLKAEEFEAERDRLMAELEEAKAE